MIHLHILSVSKTERMCKFISCIVAKIH